MKNPEIIDTSVDHECYKCSGKGKLYSNVNCGCDNPCGICDVCNGTGKWREDSFILVVTQPDGTKIAFQSDNAGT